MTPITFCPIRICFVLLVVDDIVVVEFVDIVVVEFVDIVVDDIVAFVGRAIALYIDIAAMECNVGDVVVEKMKTVKRMDWMQAG